MLFSFLVYLSTFSPACYMASNGEKTGKYELKRMQKEHGTAKVSQLSTHSTGGTEEKQRKSVVTAGVGTGNRKRHFQKTNKCKPLKPRQAMFCPSERGKSSVLVLMSEVFSNKFPPIPD